MEILGRARKYPRISENFGNASNPFLRSLNDLWNFWKTSETVQKCIRKIFGNGSKVIFRYFYDFLKFSETLRKSWEVLGNLRKFSENFGNGSKVIFRCFYDFLKFSENLRKSLEVFGNLRKISGCDRKCSQELKSFGAGFWEVLKWTPVNCCAQVMTGK